MSRIISAFERYARWEAGFGPTQITPEQFRFDVAAALLTTLGETIATPLINSAVYEVTARVSAAFPNKAISPGQAIQLYYQRAITGASLNKILGWHGIYFNPSDNIVTLSVSQLSWFASINRNWPRVDISTAASLWRQGLIGWQQYRERLLIAGLHDDDVNLMQQQGPFFPLEVAINRWRSGFSGEAEIEESIARAGLNRSDIIDAYKAVHNPIPIGAAIGSHWLETIPPDVVRLEVQRNGYGMEGDFERVTNIVAPFAPADAADMLQKGLLHPVDVTKHLRANGYVEDNWRNLWVDAQRYYPSPGELLTFATQQSWDPIIAARYGYDLEMPAPFRYWMARRGADWGGAAPEAPGDAGGAVTWTDLHWRSHWLRMSDGRAMDAVHRLRPDRIGRYQELVPGVVPFEQRDVELAFQQAGYSPTVRRWLAALSYAPMELRTLRTGYTVGAVAQADAIAGLQDRGYLRDDAERIVAVWDAQALDKLGAPIRGMVQRTGLAVVREVLAGYREGLVPRGTALQRLNEMYTAPIEWGRQLDVIDSQLLRASVAAYLKGVRSEYLAGNTSTADLGARLAASGISAPAANYYANRWTAERTTRVRSLSTAQILGALKDGIIDEPAAAARLANLGWVGGDILIQVAGIRQKISQAQQRILAQQGRAAMQAAKQLAQAAKQAQQARSQAIKLLRGTYPKADMKRWLKEGIVGPNWVRSMMTKQQYPPDYIQAFLEDASYVKPPKPKAPPKTGAPPAAGPTAPPATGGSGGP